MNLNIRKIQVNRYVTPLREGGSLPAIAEGNDGVMYVVKFRGAGQGIKALTAEFIGGQIAKAMELTVPEIVLADIDEAFGRTEPDEEIQDLLKASVGLNLGLRFLSGALTFDPAANKIDPLLASKILWLDMFILNVDRTAKNTNLLIWNRELWAIDHGAALYFHHNWTGWEEYIQKPFARVKDHVLLQSASKIEVADEEIKSILNAGIISDICEAVPDEFLIYSGLEKTPHEIRTVYKKFLTERLKHSDHFVKYAIDAR